MRRFSTPNKIAIVLAVAAALLMAAVLAQPETYTVSRSASIKAPAGRIYPLIADLHAWSQWSPWDKLDPQIQRSWSGATSGVGAVYSWSGNDQVGKGKMTVVQAQPNALVAVRMELEQPWPSVSASRFELAAQGDTTEVVWTMIGHAEGLGAKATSLLMNMDRLVGADFERGLAELKALAEQSL